MKTKCYLCIAFSFLTGLFLQRANAQANRELSNLVSPTKVNQSLLPNNDNTRNLGSATRSWKDVYLDGSLYLAGLRFLSNGGNLFGLNVFIGSSAGLNTTTGINNTAGGHVALFKNTTGSKNTAVGYAALYNNTTGEYNAANGYEALNSNTFGDANTANGSYTLYSNTTGNYNTADGGSAGSYNDMNTNCTFIGYDADQIVSTDFTNSTALGNTSRITASNQVRIGNSSVTSIGCYEPWTNLSDGRFKKNVKDNVPGLAFINELRAITYTIDVTSLTNFVDKDRQDKIMRAEGKTVREKNPEAEALIQKGIQEKEKMIRTGFVAQEVEEAAKRIGYDFSGVDKPKNEHTPYGLRYSEFVVPLVKAVQELSKQNDDLKEENEELKSRLDKIEAIVFQSQSPLQHAELGMAAKLVQNIPNPFNGTTTINYYLPANKGNAYINFYTSSGALLKSVKVSDNSGTLTVKANELPSGVYQYALVVDAKVVDRKQMVQGK